MNVRFLLSFGLSFLLAVFVLSACGDDGGGGGPDEDTSVDEDAGDDTSQDDASDSGPEDTADGGDDVPGDDVGEDVSEDAEEDPVEDVSPDVEPDVPPVGCDQCEVSGQVCVDDEYCAESCPDERDRCGGEAGDICCDGGDKCCDAASLGLDADVCVPADDPCPVACDNGVSACPAGTLCLEDLDTGDNRCVDSAECAGPRCGFNTCCPAGSACVDDVCTMPDLVPIPDGALDSIRLSQRVYAGDSCQVAEGCVADGGLRDLLHFAVKITNLSDAPVELGTPGNNDAFGVHFCETEPVLRDFISWRLTDFDNNELTSGVNSTTCLSDEETIGGDSPTYTCTFQGLSNGFTSAQPASACDFADVTDIAPGSYKLEVTINAAGTVPERDRTNNRLTVTVEIPENICEDGSMCGGVCCPEGACENDTCMLPDLTVDVDDLMNSLRISEETFSAGNCAIVEGCLNAPGDRRLLRFNTTTPNIGNADLYLGPPSENNDLYEFSPCHNHYHFNGYASYLLLDEDGEIAARGHKQAFCLIDLRQVDPDAPGSGYNCSNQGISRGWADIYSSGLDCQWVDITGVPEGNYMLEVALNVDQTLPELTYDNNVVRVPVYIPEDPNGCVVENEICFDGRDQNCNGVPDDGCEPITGNDTCAEAFELTDGVPTTATITGADGADVSPSCGGAGAELFFTFDVEVDELVYISTYGSSIDTILAVYHTDCTGNDVECVDDGCGTQQEHFAGILGSGRYYVAVKAKDAGATGDIQILLDKTYCRPIPEITGSGDYTGDTSDEFHSSGAACATASGPDESWYFVTCPGSVDVSLSTCGGSATHDTVVEIRPGGCNVDTSPELCNDDQVPQCAENHLASSLTTTLDGAGIWIVHVDGFGANDFGPYDLSVSIE